MSGATGTGPIVVGGNGHSGTRIFIDIISHSGAFCGIPGISKRRQSSDLRMIDLLNRWSIPYVYGRLDAQDVSKMKREFATRLRILFPFRRHRWGFKNPRCMLILPVLHEIFPDMKFVHVVRDGRDISLGNQLARNNQHVGAYLEPGEDSLPPSQQMILFWGRSNERAMEFGTRHLGENYRLMRWEDLCSNPAEFASQLVLFAGGPGEAATGASAMVQKPSSIGRWKSYPAEVRDPVDSLGQPWLRMFGYA